MGRTTAGVRVPSHRHLTRGAVTRRSDVAPPLGRVRRRASGEIGTYLGVTKQERSLVEPLAPQPPGDLVVALARVAGAARRGDVPERVAAAARDRLHAVALQLWSAAQTDFDPFEVDSSDWPETAVPVRDADIAVDTRLEVDDVRAALERLDGVKVVVGREAGTVSVLRVVPQDTPL